MHRLEQDFGDEIEFFVLNVDFPDARQAMDAYGIRNRSTYVLLNAAGEEVMRWSGPLEGEQVAAELAAFLESGE
ncbi:MAG: hypothetical protein IPM53_33550 [Anaerolineaceae bacterium]|nr:hypothetical protein [Anaerolineaceae bacterium]